MPTTSKSVFSISFFNEDNAKRLHFMRIADVRFQYKNATGEEFVDYNVKGLCWVYLGDKGSFSEGFSFTDVADLDTHNELFFRHYEYENNDKTARPIHSSRVQLNPDGTLLAVKRDL